jgi:hypothetical protein
MDLGTSRGRRLAVAACLGTAALALLALGITLISLLPSAASENPQSVLVEEAVSGVPEVNLLQHDGRKFYLVRLPNGSLTALDRVAPQRGCVVPLRPAPQPLAEAKATEMYQATGHIFRDPCSGTAWDLAGVWLSGSIAQNMTAYAVSENGDGSLDLVLDRPQCTRREADSERQPVPCGVH